MAIACAEASRTSACTTSKEDRSSEAFSTCAIREACGSVGMRYAIIAATTPLDNADSKDVASVGTPDVCRAGAPLERVTVPTVLAISGEEQLHVSRFIRSLNADKRGWQVLTPLRDRIGTHYLFDPPGVELVVQFMLAALCDNSGAIAPSGIEGGKFHLVGNSNGGAAVLAVASRMPELVASLSLVTGFIPQELEDLSCLKTVPSIHLYAGDKDELGHNIALQGLSEQLEHCGVQAELHILPGVRHGNIGINIDKAAFWRTLEDARPRPSVCMGNSADAPVGDDADVSKRHRPAACCAVS
eukprot:TRINITY_DN47441_c0_g1_i1.p1 TRINITY_DN47441_c0_g1~~TRINITY_DN47441_c0_g1_i1.p1  ORF type:complete len:300 (+),score=58.26 TRINITY_DN47441_c0_g1_i1:88-987(+)